MKPSTFQETTENQFDYICKKVIEDERKDYFKHLTRLKKKEISFSEMGNYVFNQLATKDQYTVDKQFFELDDAKIGIENKKLGAALDLLSEKKRKIILLYYFMDMNEGEIAEVMHVSRSTVNRQRTQALSLMKECIEEVYHMKSIEGEDTLTFTEPAKKTYTISEIARILNISKKSAYRLVQQESFHSVRVGRLIRVSKFSFDKWLSQ
ncbi:hypothetical protein TMUPMC115_2313 [Tetragenococcus muriaticus PMC-11-5]|uniref:DNA-binding protein n=4 Tax=Tetragenococcus muriaticus TaxID=64642 RepID=A0A091BWG5_9ENTE|nr:hypothetical protein TMU3MR103_2248 [Tetragenococcus muriaticus 3MR10-3]KFN89688.1 hypothetical protein TMUPMC115_2313 [Tetragenococcus muriaticus PMC-11-5]